MFDYFANIDWTQTWATVLVGIGIVFAVLLILVAICWAMGKIFSSLGGGSKPEKKEAPKAAPAAKAAAPAPAAAPVVEDGITDEVVAAITAAIACMMGTGKAFAVRSVRRAEVRSTRNAWSAAGIAENTRPF